MAGLDLVRGVRGRFGVLEDNVRTPSGLAYALAARECLDARLPSHLADGRQPLDGAVDMLASALRKAAPEGVSDPAIVVLSDGPANSAWYEHERIARMLDVPVVAARRPLGRRRPARGARRRYAACGSTCSTAAPTRTG